MKILVTTCYSHLLYMILQGEKFQHAVYKYSSSSPDFQHEGVLGYVEVKLDIDIKNLESFAELWSSWYIAPNSAEFYHKMHFLQ